MRAVMTAVGLLAVIGMAAAQDWRELKPPPLRRDISALYECVTPLDPLSDPAKWQGAVHGQSAPVTVTAGPGREAGKPALRVQYEFTGAAAVL